MRPIARSWVALAALPAFTLPISAQTTPTERAAAAEVVERIDALQAEIRPEERAGRLVEARRDAKAALLDRVQGLWYDELQAVSDHIGRNPEPGFQEHESVDTLTKILEARGFQVETGVAGLETAFEASWTSPAGAEGPALGIIVE